MPKKCVVCGQIIKETDETVPYKNRYAHINCFNSAVKMIRTEKNKELKEKEEEKKKKTRIKKQTTKAELKNGLTDEEYKEKREYYDYLKKLTGEDKLNAKSYVLSEKYIEQYGFTWNGMKDTLVYLNEIKEKELTGDIVGIIAYYYDEAQSFYEEVKRVEENNKEALLSDMYQTKRITYHKRPQKVIEDLVIESINNSK